MLLLKSPAEIYFEEADELLEKGDLIQASEKYYKAAEEAIKILTITLELQSIIEKVKNEKEWSLEVLNEASFELTNILGDFVLEAWKSATALITVNLDKEIIKRYKEEIKKLVDEANIRFNSKIYSRG
ncbi:PaREP1 family protein [Sulfurisphaera javensis]|uniref:PaREP1 family protein n=1 Tax=Sulfurisphaera javensis TaxID=2049879 RepID=A0AAT9GNL0_9CREN